MANTIDEIIHYIKDGGKMPEVSRPNYEEYKTAYRQAVQSMIRSGSFKRDDQRERSHFLGLYISNYEPPERTVDKRVAELFYNSGARGTPDRGNAVELPYQGH
ncbi:hypothetical protein HYU11_05700 [Candidatus Woesearchaeota archaeon]|nr:hypothetical protein [Candidatus Woesearchaeota archaeon]